MTEQNESKADKILEGLNVAQQQAVTDYEHPSLIVAGAGSGKTRVLTCRIAYMLANGVKPWSILSLTFTNKAAREMRDRITAMVGEQSRYIWMGTFHSVFAKILFAQAERIGYQPSFTIYDQQQSQSLTKQIIKELELSEEVYKPRDVHSRISLAKNNLLTAASYQANAALTGEDRERRQPQFADIYLRYQARLVANNAMDFDDLLLNMNILLRDCPDVWQKYAEQFEYILVDEYQDTNNAQYMILKRLSANNSKICVVGDDAQSIYSFRGARIENILRFKSDFPNAKVFKLEQNYRSTQTIVDAANSVIEKNRNRIPKTVFSENERGEKIKVIKAYTDSEEARLLADDIRQSRYNDSLAWSDFAILYRTNAQSRSIEEALRRKDIPYRIFGGHSFYERKEIKDLLAYFKLIINPRDNDAFERIINYPSRGIGDVTVSRIKSLAEQRGVSMWEALDAVEPDSEQAKAVGKRVATFVELIRSLALDREGKSLYEFGMEVAASSGILAIYKNDTSPEAQNALSNIEELLNSMGNTESAGFATIAMAEEHDDQEAEHTPTLEEWLQNISLLTDRDTDKDDGGKDWVTLMTVHAAKGLEFDTVYVAGMEENLFPSIMSIASAVQLEEERRLFYVAITRAKRRAVLSFAQMRFKWGNTEMCRESRFLSEIDSRYIDADFDTDEQPATASDSQPRNATLSPQERFNELRKRYDNRNSRPYGSGNEHSAPQSRPATPYTEPKNMTSVGRREAGATAPEKVVGAAQYRVGQRVRHARFGEGTIKSIEKMAADLKITVIFADEQIGEKALLSKYAKLETPE